MTQLIIRQRPEDPAGRKQHRPAPILCFRAVFPAGEPSAVASYRELFSAGRHGASVLIT